MMTRPSKEAAQSAIKQFLADGGITEDFTMIEDGDACWAFWIDEADTTSYVHPDLTIEWYGKVDGFVPVDPKP